MRAPRSAHPPKQVPGNQPGGQQDQAYGDEEAKPDAGRHAPGRVIQHTLCTGGVEVPAVSGQNSQSRWHEQCARDGNTHGGLSYV